MTSMNDPPAASRCSRRVELARTFGARLEVLTVVREVEALLQAKTAQLGYDLIARVSRKPDRRFDPAYRCLRPKSQYSRHARRQHLCRSFEGRRRSQCRSRGRRIASPGHEGLPARHQCGTGRAPRSLFGSRRPGVNVDGGSLDPHSRGLSENEATARLDLEGPNTLPRS